MKKLISLILCALMLTACAGLTAYAADDSLEAAIVKVLDDKVPVKISFWTGTGAANFPFLETMVQAFQAQYPNITVDFSNQGPIGELTGKLTQNIVSKSTPTISNLAPTTFYEYVRSGAIVDMAPYYDNERIGFTEEEKAAFYPHFIEQGQSYGPEGTMYGFPTNKKTTDILIYNKTIFDENSLTAPATWDDVVAACEVIKEATGIPGLSFDGGAYTEAVFKTLSQQWGSPYITADGVVDIDNDASRAALAFYKSNMDAGLFTQAALMPSASGNYSNNGFLMGECFMNVGTAAGAYYSIPKAESGHKMFELGVAPLPQKDLSAPYAFFKGEDYCMFANSTAEERVAAWLLIKFMSQDENNIEWLINSANLPITKTMLDVPEYAAFLATEADGSVQYYKAAAIGAVLEMQDFLKVDRIIENTAAVAKECGVLWESVMIGGADIDTALADATAKLK